MKLTFVDRRFGQAHRWDTEVGDMHKAWKAIKMFMGTNVMPHPEHPREVACGQQYVKFSGPGRVAQFMTYHNVMMSNN